MEQNSKEQSEQTIQTKWDHLIKGDRTALDWLFRFFYQQLFDYGIRLHRDEELVQDCIQELFLSLWIKHDRLTRPDSVKAYILIALRNLIYDQLKEKKKKNEKQKAIETELFERRFEEHELNFKEEITAELKSKLVIAINQLNNKQRETLFLRYYNGLTNKEIADVMDINYQSVKNNLSRALINLRGVVKTLGLNTLLVILRSLEIT